MHKELSSISSRLENTLGGSPWFGRPVYAILQEVDPSTAYEHPNGKGHSLIELLYHCINWVAFALRAVENKPGSDVQYYEKHDWITIDPKKHHWQAGLQELKETHRQLVDLLQTKEDDLLDQTVPGRKYNYRLMLNGLIEHNIYHLGQMAYIKKFLV